MFNLCLATIEKKDMLSSDGVYILLTQNVEPEPQGWSTLEELKIERENSFLLVRLNWKKPWLLCD